MSTARYPLYILETDDHSFREVTSETGLDWYEPIDIEDGLYIGWDSSGRQFLLKWNNSTKTREIDLEDRVNLEAFKRAAIEYSQRWSTLRKKPKHKCDPATLLQRVDEIVARPSSSD